MCLAALIDALLGRRFRAIAGPSADRGSVALTKVEDLGPYGREIRVQREVMAPQRESCPSLTEYQWTVTVKEGVLSVRIGSLTTSQV